jgi:hypothetical protein
MPDRAADVPPDLRGSVIAAVLVAGLSWVGVFETIVEGDAAAIRPRRVAIVVAVTGASWLIRTWWLTRDKS